LQNAANCRLGDEKLCLALALQLSLKSNDQQTNLFETPNMHASQLAEIGSWTAVYSETLIFGASEQPPLIANDYWIASKTRLSSWTTALKLFDEDLRDPSPFHDPWPAIETVVQEILVSEFMTRVFSASVLTHDWYQGTDELHGLSHSIHVSHIEAKNRAIRLLLKGQADNETVFDRLNILRRKIERWTDLFLAQVPNLPTSKIFAFDVNRVADFHNEQRLHKGPDFLKRQQLLMASFGTEMKKYRSAYSANPALNSRIGSSVLGCFPADRFDSLGLPKSARMLWIEKAQSDTQLLIDELVDFENEQDKSNGAFATSAPHFRNN
jgi:hypothetical protein